MHIDLSGTTAVVSGSTQGIGLAIVRGLAGAGSAVVLNGRSQATVERAVASVENDVPGASVRGVAADLATVEGAEQLLSAVPSCDILVNNLGIFDPKPFLEIDDDEWLRFFQINVMSGIRLSRAYLPGMIDKGWGRVVFVSSESALQIPPEMVHYGMTKTAQLAISRGLAEFCAGTGVTVNSILPGPTASEGVSEFVWKMGAQEGQTQQEATDEFVRVHRPTQLLRRAATPDEVAAMAVYLCSRQASATTGSSVSVDGGTRRSIV